MDYFIFQNSQFWFFGSLSAGSESRLKQPSKGDPKKPLRNFLRTLPPMKPYGTLSTDILRLIGHLTSIYAMMILRKDERAISVSIASLATLAAKNEVYI